MGNLTTTPTATASQYGARDVRMWPVDTASLYDVCDAYVGEPDGAALHPATRLGAARDAVVRHGVRACTADSLAALLAYLSELDGAPDGAAACACAWVHALPPRAAQLALTVRGEHAVARTQCALHMQWALDREARAAIASLATFEDAAFAAQISDALHVHEVALRGAPRAPQSGGGAEVVALQRRAVRAGEVLLRAMSAANELCVSLQGALLQPLDTDDDDARVTASRLASAVSVLVQAAQLAVCRVPRRVLALALAHAYYAMRAYDVLWSRVAYVDAVRAMGAFDAVPDDHPLPQSVRVRAVALALERCERDHGDQWVDAAPEMAQRTHGALTADLRALYPTPAARAQYVHTEDEIGPALRDLIGRQGAWIALVRDG